MRTKMGRNNKGLLTKLLNQFRKMQRIRRSWASGFQMILFKR